MNKFVNEPGLFLVSVFMIILTFFLTLVLFINAKLLKFMKSIRLCIFGSRMIIGDLVDCNVC